MGETPSESMTGSGHEMEYDEKNSGNGNDDQIVSDDGE